MTMASWVEAQLAVLKNMLQPIPLDSTLLGGTAPVIECCDGGLAWARVTNATWADTVLTAAGFKCTGWTITIEFGIARCAPTADTSGFVSPTDSTAFAEQQIADMMTLLDFSKTLSFSSAPTIEPLSISGGCGGATLTGTVNACV